MKKSILSTLLAIVALLLTSTTTQGQNSVVDTQKRVIEAIKKQLSEGEARLSSIRKDKNSVQSRVSSLALQVEQRNRLLDAQKIQIELLQNQIDNNIAHQDSLSVELSKEQEAYSRMVREAYRNYQHNNYISYLFAADDFNDIARRIVNIRHAAKLRELRIVTIDSLRIELDSTRTLLLARKSSLDSVAQDISKQKGHLQRDIDAARTNINEMSTKEKNTLKDNALQQQKLNTAIEELRKLTKGNIEGNSFTASTSNLNLPVSGGKVKRYMDNMAEVIGAQNASVIAIYEGKVVDVKQNRITGKYDIYIAHGEYITSYAGLRSSSVTKGSSVKKNQTIGVVGTSVDILTMESEHKIIFGIYPPNPNQKMKASECFKK
ncbi:MAG: peptidoglycan DD-metalloendopeptidase family protein [Rikenellaceae bacterium]